MAIIIFFIRFKLLVFYWSFFVFRHFLVMRESWLIGRSSSQAKLSDGASPPSNMGLPEDSTGQKKRQAIRSSFLPGHMRRK
jgi:hypothetical protein